MEISIGLLIKEVESLKDGKKAKILSSFFKTGKGQYGEGDIFFGITVPILRKIAKKYKDLKLKDLDKVISSKVHEYRFVALQILIFKYKAGNFEDKKTIVDYYLRHKKYVNNWDLVDTSAPYILGDWLIDKDKSILYRLALSKNLWDKRISIISTFSFIKKDDFSTTTKLVETLLEDKHDLIHKANGWMLREIGKRSKITLNNFLDRTYKKLPRTTLRYAIERFDEKERKKYLS